MREKNSRYLFWVVILSLLILWSAGNVYDLKLGLADNGDWYRSTRWFSSGPLGFAPDGTALSQEEHQARYYQYWLPYWQLDASQLRSKTLSGLVVTSNLLLWLPGVGLCRLFLENRVLSLAVISLIPRLLVGLNLAMILAWVSVHFKKQRTWLVVLIGLPLVGITITPAYNAYFNSFFQESGDIAFFLFFSAALLWFTSRPQSRLFFGLVLIAAVLLGSSKASHFYWPTVTGVFLLLFPEVRRSWPRWTAIGLAVGLSILMFNLNQSDGMMAQNRFNRLYSGLLSFSQNRQYDLAVLGLQGSEDCIDEMDYYADNRLKCVENLEGNSPISSMVKIILHDPAILFRQAAYTAGQLQKISLRDLPVESNNLGYFAQGDNRLPNENWVWSWEILKENAFPKGFTFWVFIFLASIVLGWQIRHGQSASGAAKLGLFLIATLLIEMVVAILGDGKYELVKHLLLANLIFDGLFVLVISICMGWMVNTIKKNLKPQQHELV